MKKDFKWAKDPDLLIEFLDEKTCEVTGVTRDFVPSIDSLEPNSSFEGSGTNCWKLIEALDGFKNGTKNQDSLVLGLTRYFRDKRPDASEDDVCRFVFHCSAWIVMDHLFSEEWKGYEARSKAQEDNSQEEIEAAYVKHGFNATHARKALPFPLSKSQFNKRLTKEGKERLKAKHTKD